MGIKSLKKKIFEYKVVNLGKNTNRINEIEFLLNNPLLTFMYHNPGDEVLTPNHLLLRHQFT